jgi:hypothetical protein
MTDKISEGTPGAQPQQATQAEGKWTGTGVHVTTLSGKQVEVQGNGDARRVVTESYKLKKGASSGDPREIVSSVVEWKQSEQAEKTSGK